jgi:four helix bundle protein
MEMKNRNELGKRFYKFALRIVKFAKNLPRTWIALEIGRQLLKSGTSIDANYEEACGAFSKQDFIYKLNIAFKEAKETNYWLRLLNDSMTITTPEIDYLIQESKEISNILGKSVITSRSKK